MAIELSVTDAVTTRTPELRTVSTFLAPPLPNLTVRPVGWSELEQLIDFDQMAMIQHNDLPKDHLPPSLTLSELQASLLNGDIIDGVFLPDGEMVGYGWDELKKDYFYVSSTAIHPDYRNYGLGPYFMRKRHLEALRRGYLTSLTAASQFNGSSLHLCFKFGYQVVDYKPAYFGNEYPDTPRLILQAKLHDTPPILDPESNRLILCKQTDQIIEALGQGLVGVQLERSETGDNGENKIKFAKAVKSSLSGQRKRL